MAPEIDNGGLILEIEKTCTLERMNSGEGELIE
jgi:hypothetical protein